MNRFPFHISGARSVISGALGLSAAFALAGNAAAAPADFGSKVEQLLGAQVQQQFGFGAPTTAADAADNGLTRAQESAQQRQDLAKGLTAEFVARNVAFSGDMISFWPNDLNYTHLMVCIEQGRTPGGSGADTGRNAGV
jgi:hypothetical protein